MNTQKWNTCPFLLIVLLVVRDGVWADGRCSALFRRGLRAVHIVTDAVRLLGGSGVWAGRSRSLTFADVPRTGGVQRQEGALHQLILQGVNKLLRLQTEGEQRSTAQHKSVWHGWEAYQKTNKQTRANSDGTVDRKRRERRRKRKKV